MKNIRIFYLKICQFLVIKFSVYLNWNVFVMGSNIIQLQKEADTVDLSGSNTDGSFTMANSKSFLSP